MKIKVLEQGGNSMKFSLEGSSVAFANSLRRVMMSEVPTMTVEWVDFHENSSALYDEVVAHRLGLIPLTFDAENYNLPDECTCEGKGCSQCQVVLVLDKKGPCVVYSGDMKSTDESVKPTSPKFPIVELLENQSIRLDAVAQLGRGVQHAKWQAANASYKYDDNKAFIFAVESVSGLSPGRIVEKAADIIGEKSREFVKELEAVGK